MAIARQWDRHSKLVFWAKVLLPLCAIIVLSTLFMVSHAVRPEDAIPYADVDIETLANEPRLTAPVFAGMTSDGAALSMRATEARVGGARVGGAGSASGGQITDLIGLLETPDGARTHLTAKEADLDQSVRQAVLTGDVVISNSIGYKINSQTIHVALDQTSVDSPGAITADGPAGKITAGTMHLGLAGAAGSGYLLVFKGGVTLLYLPSGQGSGD